MKTTLFAAAGAFALTAALFSGSARADCFWTGLNWTCTSSQPYYSAPYPGYYPGYYYAPYWGYRPGWLPSYPGPRQGAGGSSR